MSDAHTVRRAAARRHSISTDFGEAQAFIEARGWSDGLPVIPPTEALVQDMMSTCPSMSATTSLGTMEPAKGDVTVEKVAANAVMAGCRKEYFPVVVAAVKAVLQPQFHVGSTAVTTGGAAPAIVVSGPAAIALGINADTACFGGNVKANATIGRALRLTMRNLGGAKPGGMEKSTHAWPGKISLCFAENEARSPWAPLRADFGFPSEATTVSVVAVRGLYTIAEGVQQTGLGVLETIASGMRVGGCALYYQMGVPVLVCLSPEHAGDMARQGMSKQDVRQYLFEHCRLPVKALKHRGYYSPGCWGSLVDENDDDALVPIVSDPKHVWIIVAGGDGRHTTWMPAWNVCEGATQVVPGTGD
jgi:hypothetical protein